MKITVLDFINKFKNDKVMNSKINEHAVSDYLKKELEIKTYIPFRTKREIVELVVKQNIAEVDGIKKHDAIDGYVSFVIAMLSMYTNFEFNKEDPVVDYDLLAESGLLPLIIAEFQADYDECNVLLKMALASELEDNNVNALVAKFLNGILNRLDGAGEMIKSVIEGVDLNAILGESFKQEDLAKLSSFLDKYNK